MKLHYYPETASLYIELSSEPAVDAGEVLDGLVAAWLGSISTILRLIWTLASLRPAASPF